MQIFTAAWQSFSMELMMPKIYGYHGFGGRRYPINLDAALVRYPSALAMARVPSVGGWRIIKPLVPELSLSRPAVLPRLCSNHYYYSYPTQAAGQHVPSISSSIMGVARQAFFLCTLVTAQQMVIAWVILPITATLAGIIYLLVALF